MAISPENRLKLNELLFIWMIIKARYKDLIVLAQISTVLIFTPLFFYFDGKTFNHCLFHGQWLSNIIMFYYFSWFYIIADQKLRRKLWIIVFLSTLYEICLSLVMELYIYRLDFIPLYIPFGHAIVFATVYYLRKQPLIRKNSKGLIPILYGFVLLLSCYSLVAFNDKGGFGCSLLFLLFLFTKRSKLFYLLMFLMTYYLEVAGTTVGSWAWYGALGNHLDYPSVANPPVGVGFVYMTLDLLTNKAYFWSSQLQKKYRLNKSPAILELDK